MLGWSRSLKTHYGTDLQKIPYTVFSVNYITCKVISDFWENLENKIFILSINIQSLNRKHTINLMQPGTVLMNLFTSTITVPKETLIPPFLDVKIHSFALTPPFPDASQRRTATRNQGLEVSLLYIIWDNHTCRKFWILIGWLVFVWLILLAVDKIIIKKKTTMKSISSPDEFSASS